MYNCGFNNSCFGLNGMMPGGLLPGSTVKISQSTTGSGASIFSKNQPTTTTNITVNNGPSGFWGFASGLMNGISGNPGYGMGMGMGMGMGGYSQFGMGGYGGAYVNPQEVSMLSNYMYTSGMSALNGTGTTGLSGIGTGTPALNNLKELAKGIGGTVVDNGNGTFTLQVSGHKGVVNGSFADIQAKIEEYSEQGVKASATASTSTAGGGSGGVTGGSATV